MSKNSIENKQDVLLLTGNGKGVRVSFDASPDSIIDYRNNRAWELAYSQQCVDERGNSLQVISEIAQTPIKIYPERPDLKSDASSDLFNRKVKEGISTTEANKNRNGMMLWVGIVAALISIAITAAVLVAVLPHATGG